jgi:hypothetical protein
VVLYASFVYGTIYSILDAFPIVFLEHRGFYQVIIGLPFLTLSVILLSAAGNLANPEILLQTLCSQWTSGCPKARLPLMMFSSVIFAGEMFLFAWTTVPPRESLGGSWNFGGAYTHFE